MNSLRLLFWALALWPASPLGAQDFLHLSLQLELDTVEQRVMARVEHRIAKLSPDSALFLNGIKMDYHRVRFNGRRVRYRAVDTGIWVYPKGRHLRDTNLLSISYSAQPRKGIYFTGYEDTSGLAPHQIWTQGQGIDHRHWIPHRDDQRDKITFDIQVRFNARYSVMSNGVLKKVQRSGEEKIWHYQLDKPMSSYLIALAIGRYDSAKSQSASQVPLTQYFYLHRASDYRWYYAHNEEIFNFLEEEIGLDYPWPNYKQAPVRDFRHGAMENTTATIFGDFFLVDSLAFPDRNYTYVNAHELAHQWFGNLITAPNSVHHWLHEGFATYYQWLSERNLYGQDLYDWERHKAAQMVFEASAVDSFPLAHPRAGSARFYQKGAWLLHQLRAQVGDSVFRAAARQFLTENAYGIVTNRQWREMVEQYCHCALDDFFAYWLRTAGEAKVKIAPLPTADAQAPAQWILQLRGALQHPLHMEFWGTEPHSGQTKIWLAGLRDTSFTFTPPPGTQFWRWANADDHLVQLAVQKPDSLWRAQFYRARGQMLEQRRALAALRDSTAANRRLLLSVLTDSSAFFALRSVALERLLALEPDTAQREAHWLQAAGDREVSLQKEAVKMLPWSFPAADSALAHLRAHGASYQLRLLALQRSINTQKPKANRWLYQARWQQEPGFPDREIYLTVLVYRLIYFEDLQALEQLVFNSSPAYSFGSRLVALQFLGALNLVRRDVLDSYAAAFISSNWQLRKQARENLQKAEQKYPERIATYLESLSARYSSEQLERLKNIFDRS